MQITNIHSFKEIKNEFLHIYSRTYKNLHLSLYGNSMWCSRRISTCFFNLKTPVENALTNEQKANLRKLWGHIVVTKNMTTK